ncbi:MAG: CRISPR-associated endoribonuclease [Candidatus Poribacteria bacterium]|nr:MAG: CRISPR-associated endoribonuclease [Candidatus Poribacteria bacterium]
MRLRFTLEAATGSELELPRQYNSLVQGFVYRHLDGWLAEFLHDRGVPDPESEARRMRLFTFSRLLPAVAEGSRWHFRGERIVFTGPAELVVASPMEPFLRSLAERVVLSGGLLLGDQEVRLLSVAVEPLPEYTSPVRVHALSPITVYRTLQDAQGRRKTYYFSPFEDEFEAMLVSNLQRKLRAWRALQGVLGIQEERDRGEETEGRIRRLRVSRRDEHIVRYKGTVVKAWTGVYELKLPPGLFQMAFDTGLGAKNSQGFGCIGLWEPGPRGEARQAEQRLKG